MSKHIFELMDKVARKLVGRDVVIRYQAPLSAGIANAATYRALDGTPVIDIGIHILNTDANELFRVYTHELAHAKLHTPIMQPVDVSNRQARYHTPATAAEARRATPAEVDAAHRQVNAIEAEAEAQANIWRDAAYTKSIRYMAMTTNPFERLLLALLYDYKP